MTTDLLLPFLVFHTGPQAGQQRLLDRPALTIGRLDDNDLAIDDARVSRRHAHICRDDVRYIVEDLGSTNGTWLNGARLDAPAQLHNGDQIRIADVALVFHDPNATTQARAFQALSLDEVRGEVVLGGQRVKLTAKELALMRLLAARPGQVCSKDQIAQAVWPEYGGDITDCNIEGLVNRLRRKIEPDPQSPVYLCTRRGLGYVLVV